MSHRRNLAPSTMDPTTKKHSSSSNPTNVIKHQRHPNPIPSSTLHKLKPHFPKPNFLNSTHIPNPSSSLKSPDPPRVVDIHLQAKSLTLSANADSSYLLKKPHSHQIRHQQPQQQKHPMEAKQRSKQGIEKKIKPRQGNRDPEPEPEPELVEDIDLKLSSVSLNGGRRKSWSDSKIELGDFFFNLSARVVSVDMPPFMQIHAVSCARKVYDSLEKASSSKTLASTLKKEFDGVYGPAWHCIVGTSFGSFVTHSVNGFFYFSLDHKLYILLFKTTVQRAD